MQRGVKTSRPAMHWRPDRRPTVGTRRPEAGGRGARGAWRDRVPRYPGAGTAVSVSGWGADRTACGLRRQCAAVDRGSGQGRRSAQGTPVGPSGSAERTTTRPVAMVGQAATGPAGHPLAPGGTVMPRGRASHPRDGANARAPRLETGKRACRPADRRRFCTPVGHRLRGARPAESSPQTLDGAATGHGSAAPSPRSSPHDDVTLSDAAVCGTPRWRYGTRRCGAAGSHTGGDADHGTAVAEPVCARPACCPCRISRGGPGSRLAVGAPWQAAAQGGRCADARRGGSGGGLRRALPL